MNIFKQIFRATPKVGDNVKVAVGFSSFEEKGVVSSVHTTTADKYCWINQFYPNGKFKHSFTASLSYCHFVYI